MSDRQVQGDLGLLNLRLGRAGFSVWTRASAAGSNATASQRKSRQTELERRRKQPSWKNSALAVWVAELRAGQAGSRPHNMSAALKLTCFPSFPAILPVQWLMFVLNMDEHINGVKIRLVLVVFCSASVWEGQPIRREFER